MFPTTPDHRRFYQETEFVLVTLLVVAVCVPRLTVLPVWGEESRWAVGAREMIASGNFVVPTQRGIVYPDRPPLLSWTMIIAAKVLGHFDLTAVRLPSAVAMLVTVWLIYGYARTFLSAHGALAAGPVRSRSRPQHPVFCFEQRRGAGQSAV